MNALPPTDATFVPAMSAIFFWDRTGDLDDPTPFGQAAKAEALDLFVPDARRVAGVSVPVEDASEWLAPLGTGRAGQADSLVYWAVAARVGLELVARGRVVQVARPGATEDGLNVTWMPVLTSSADRRRRLSLARAMPGAARAATPERTTAGLLDDFWCALVDALLRRAHTALPPTFGWEADLMDHLAAPRGADWHVESPGVRDCVLRWLTPPPVAETWEGVATIRPPESDEGLWNIRYSIRSGEDAGTVLDEVAVVGEGSAIQRAALARVRSRIEELTQLEGPVDRVDAHAVATLAESVPAPGSGAAMDALLETESGEVGDSTSIVLPGTIRDGTRSGVHARLRGAAGARQDDRLSSPLLAELAGTALSWELAVGDRVLTPEEVADLLSGRRPLIRLDDNWLLVTERGRAELAARLEEPPPNLGPGEIVAAALGGRLPLSGAESIPVAVSGEVAEVIALIRGGPLEGSPSPPSFDGDLRHYQERGLEWLLRLEERGLGGCLADDMGLGKTVQAIALFLSSPMRTLVVCPTSVLGNWERELHRFAPTLTPLRHHGPDRARDPGVLAAAVDEMHVVLTTYAVLRRDAEVLGEIDWDRVVLDEAQHAKNPTSETARAARRVAAGARSRLALTGTPVENTLGELWSILDFTNPGLVGSRTSFRRRFVNPVENGDTELARALKRMTGPFVLRRTKADPSVLSDLPAKHETVLYCDLTEEQKALYAAAVEDGLTGIAAARGIGRRGLVLALLTRLKQICDHGALGLASAAPEDASSGKLELLLDMIEDVTSAGDRCLVFTQYVEMGKILSAVLAAPFFHGGLSGQARDSLVDAFQAEEGPPVLVVSLRAGGQGLNLTAANRVFHYDRWWNPAVEDQASDRAHRIGQTRDVWVHKLVCIGTVEERIDSMLERKRALAGAVVAEGESWVTEMTDEELARLVELEAIS